MTHKQEKPGRSVSDEQLVLLARAGDRGAFAELWQRHSRSGMSVARHFSSSIDPEDLVSESFARIYQRILAGGGPDGAFRPYLFTTIRNLASRWGSSRRDVNVDDMSEFEDPDVADDPATTALDRTLTVRAFRTLPDRWQAVLWYTEIEGMHPHDVAPILGITPNSAAALAYRAREGLRKAWLQAHVSDATASGECAWAIARLGEYARHGLTARDSNRVRDHLATCAKCGLINEEVEDVGSRLALVLFPLILGGAAGGVALASLSSPGSAMASALPGTIASSTAAIAAPSAAAGLSISALVAPLVGTVAIALAVTGGVATTSVVAPQTHPVSTSIAAPDVAPAPTPSDPVEPDGTAAAVDDADTASTPVAAGEGVKSSLENTVVGAAPALSTVANAATSALGSNIERVIPGVGSTVKDLTTALPSAVDSVATSIANPINAVIPALVPPTPVIPVLAAPSSLSLDLSGTATQSVQTTSGSLSLQPDRKESLSSF